MNILRAESLGSNITGSYKKKGAIVFQKVSWKISLILAKFHRKIFCQKGVTRNFTSEVSTPQQVKIFWFSSLRTLLLHFFWFLFFFFFICNTVLKNFNQSNWGYLKNDWCPDNINILIKSCLLNFMWPL